MWCRRTTNGFTCVALVGAAVIESSPSLDLEYPKVDEGKLKELAAAKSLGKQVRSAVCTKWFGFTQVESVSNYSRVRTNLKANQQQLTTCQVTWATPTLFSN